MSEESTTERAVGTGSFVTVNGVDYQLSPLGIKSLTTIQKEALRFYKRQYLETFADTIDLVSNGEDLFLKERQIVAKWSYDMLPASVLHDPDSVLVTDELREKLTAKLGELPSKDDLVAALCCLHLDEGSLSVDDLGIPVRSMKTEYGIWWASTLEGMTLMVWLSLKKNHPRLSLEDVEAWAPVQVVEAARKVQQDTVPEAGNM
jgi:hypothetical protein